MTTTNTTNTTTASLRKLARHGWSVVRSTPSTSGTWTVEVTNGAQSMTDAGRDLAVVLADLARLAAA